MPDTESSNSWGDYYQRVAGRPPRALLIDAAGRFADSGLAIDLGCGSGIETRGLLRRGWRVLAIDQEPAALEVLSAGLAPPERAQLTAQCAPFDAITLPAADLIWAGLSLPFCRPDRFGAVWAKITATARPRGRIAGDLFGVRHVWRDKPDMTFQDLDQARVLFAGFEVEQFVESEEERQTAFVGVQHWHGFTFIARKLSGLDTGN